MIKEKYIVFRVMIKDDGKIACLARDCFDKFKDAKKFLKKYHKGKRLKVCNRLYTIDCVGGYYIRLQRCYIFVFEF